MATTYAYSGQTDSPWISGLPHGVHSSNLDAENILKTAVATVLVEGRRALAADIAKDTDWQPYAGMVALNWDGSNFSYEFTGTEAEIEEMRRLEYGDSTQSATRLISRSIFRLDRRVSAQVDEAVSEAIGLG